MRATGIIRRVDDLGRVVIPKEIRRTMGIREGEPLEIYTDTICGNPAICFAKYEHNFAHEAESLREAVELYMDEDDPVKQQTLIALTKVVGYLRK